MNYQTQMKLKRIGRQPFVMYFFLGLQVLIYIAMEIYGRGVGGSQNIRILNNFGAMNRDYIIQLNQWWRFITPVFIHIGLMHIVINSVTLYYIGQQAEGIFGHWRFFLIYMLSGIAGNVFSFCFGQTNSISAGASTSLFGLFATFLVLTKIYHNDPFIQNLARNFGLFIVMNLVFNLFSSGVDIMGHIGGLVGGMLTSYCVSVPQKKDELNIHIRVISGLIYIFLVAVFIIWGYQK